MLIQALLTKSPASLKDVLFAADDALGHLQRPIVTVELREHRTVLQEAPNKVDSARHSFHVGGALPDLQLLKVY